MEVNPFSGVVELLSVDMKKVTLDKKLDLFKNIDIDLITKVMLL